MASVQMATAHGSSSPASSPISKQTVLVIGAGTVGVVGAYLLYKHFSNSNSSSSSSSKSRKHGSRSRRNSSSRNRNRNSGGSATTLSPEQQARVMERVGKFLSHAGAPSKEELDRLFDDAAGEDGRVSMEEFALVVKAPLLYNVSQLVRKSVQNAALLAQFNKGNRNKTKQQQGEEGEEAEEWDEGTIEMALKIQQGIPKIEAGIPAISNAMFKALDKDGSGYLDKSEFRAALSLFDCFSDPDWVRGEPTRENLARMRPAFDLLFNAIDLKDSGRLSIRDAKTVLYDSSDFAFGFANSVVGLVSDSISGAVLSKFVARPFKDALESMDKDGSGTFSIQELNLEQKVGTIITDVRDKLATQLQSPGLELSKAPVFAQEVLQKQILNDIVAAMTSAETHLSVADKAQSLIAGGISETTFVRCCMQAYESQHSHSATAVQETLEAALAPSVVGKIVSKLHTCTDPSSANYRRIGLAGAQHKIYSAIYSLCDINSDGVVSWDEVNAWAEIQKAVTGDPSADFKKCASAIFAMVDRDGDGEVDQSEVEFLLHKLGSFGGRLAEGVLQVAQVVVRAGIDMLGDEDYQRLVSESLEFDGRLSSAQKLALKEAWDPTAARAPLDKSKITGELRDQVAIGGETLRGLSNDEAWAILMASWPGAREAANPARTEA